VRQKPKFFQIIKIFVPLSLTQAAQSEMINKERTMSVMSEELEHHTFQ
jgi:hypothetical protein